MSHTETPFGAFTDLIETADELETLVGPPLPQVVDKELDALDEICRDFIARAPFCILATANPKGYVDLSPRGDPAGFVTCVTPNLLAIPDRPGNRRVDSFHNLIDDPRIGALFLVPGRGETLRVRGTARLCQDPRLLETMKVNNRAPKLALLIHVQTAFMHCPKCVMRSNLWQPENWPESSDLADMNQAMIKHAHIAMSPEEWFEHMLQAGEIDLY